MGDYGSKHQGYFGTKKKLDTKWDIRANPVTFVHFIPLIYKQLLIIGLNL